MCLKADAVYTISDVNTGEVLASETLIATTQRTNHVQTGFSVTMGQAGWAGRTKDTRPMVPSVRVLDYADKSGSVWFNAVVDGDKWIDHSTWTNHWCPLDPIANASPLLIRECIRQTGNWHFFPLLLPVIYWRSGWPFLSPGFQRSSSGSIGCSSRYIKMDDLNNVDIVFTPNKRFVEPMHCSWNSVFQLHEKQAERPSMAAKPWK